MSRDEKRRRNHTVQRALLKRFANGRGQLIRIPLEGGRHRISINDATVLKDFYNERLATGEVDDTFERSLRQLEDPLDPTLRQLIDERRWPILPETRQYLSRWIAFQQLRTPTTRSFIGDLQDVVYRHHLKLYTAEDFGRYLGERGRPVESAEAARLFEIYRGQRGAITHGSLAEHMAVMNEFGEYLAGIILARGWTFVRSDDHGFITSDHPVAIRLRTKPDAEDQLWGIPGEIIISLDRHVVLIIGEDSREDCWTTCDEASARRLNQRMADFVRLAVYHHPADDPTIGLFLPPPYRQESVEAWLKNLLDSGPNRPESS